MSYPLHCGPQLRRQRRKAMLQNLAVIIGLAFVASIVLFADDSGAAVSEQRRIALVIGNDNYEEISKLEKAVNDADAVSKKLREIGFEVVTAKDIGRRGMSRAVRQFEKQIQPGDLALFYYAGHGFSVSGQDFLLPVDIPQAGPGDESLVRDEAFLTNDLADRFLKAGAKTAILVLDACRDNPFAQPGKRSIGGSAGLANQPLGEGIFVLYSAGQYQSALDGMGPSDSNPNSVFTRAFLKKLEEPNLSVVQIAKATQISVRDLASQVGHTQLPSYYDQIIGTVRLNPGIPGTGSETGKQREFKEGETALVLPKIDPAPKPGKAKPIANFSRSNAGWQVTVSLPEPAVQFGYRTEPEGEFTVTGNMAALDPRTGLPMPITWFSLPGDQPAGEIYVTWRDKRGEEAGVFPIKFAPEEALRSGQKQILEQLWTAWVAFPGSQNNLMYFSHLISYSCGINKVEYSINKSGKFRTWPMPKCDMDNPHTVPQNATIYRKVPRGAKNVQVRLTYYDGSTSKLRNFKVK